MQIATETLNLPTAAHFVSVTREVLLKNEFVELKETENFLLPLPEKFFVCRDEQTIAIFNITNKESAKILTTSLDYPVLKIKPNSYRNHHHCEQANVEPYGKGMWITWPDRDLAIAGRAIIKDQKTGQKSFKLVHTKYPVACIPMLAVHLRPGSSTKADLDIDKHFLPVLNFTDEVSETATQSPSILNIIAKECECDISDIVDFDLGFISAEEASVIGVNDDMLSSQQISSTVTSYIAFSEFINAKKPETGMNVFLAYSKDQEGINRTGPESDFLDSLFKRIGINNNEKNTFFSQSKIFGIKNLSSRGMKTGVCYLSDFLGNYQPPNEIVQTTINNLEGKNIKTNKISSDKIIVTGAAAIGRSLNIPTFVFGLSIFGIYSIRETIALKELNTFKLAISTILE